MESFTERVYAVVRRIPKGRVLSYGAVAAMAGNRKAARMVGLALHHNPDQERIPCHRVVFRDGALSSAFAFGGAVEHRKRLRAEGVTFTPDGRVKMDRHEL